MNPNDPLTQLRDTGLTTVYISPRWSRPLGLKTGIAIQFTPRWPIRGQSLTLFGFSNGYLSPWANAYYGPEFTLKIKTLHFAPLTLDFGVALSRKFYLRNLNDLSG